MRPTIDLRAGCALAAGVTCALTAAAIPAEAGATAPLAAPHRHSDRALVYGQRFVVAGDLGRAAGGAPLVLQYERSVAIRN